MSHTTMTTEERDANVIDFYGTFRVKLVDMAITGRLHPWEVDLLVKQKDRIWENQL